MKDAISAAVGIAMILLAGQVFDRVYAKVKYETMLQVYKGLSPLGPFTKQLIRSSKAT